MSVTVRYQNTIQGNLIQIGNTLGLSKDTNSLTPGTLGSIGTFITTQNISAPGWPINTTSNYTQNSSPSNLQLPPGAVVDYAELIWSASYIINNGSTNIGDVSANINDPINFTDPFGTVHSITIASVNYTGIGLAEGAPVEFSTNYVKATDVTTIVKNGGSGTYICGNVPCTMVAGSNFLQYAGWSLYVVYRLLGDRVRNIITYVSNERSIDVPFSIPINYPGPPFPIRAYYSAGEGDAIITGDTLYILSGPGIFPSYLLQDALHPGFPNPNPFVSIIANQSAQINTFGPFGTQNPDSLNATNVVGGRQGWDIANNIDVTAAFTGGIPVANIRMDIASNEDPAILTGIAYVVDMSQPLTSITKSVDKSVARANDTLTYTLVYDFTQVPVPTTTIVLVDTTPNGTTLIPGSVVVNGNPEPTYNLNPPGVTLANNINSPAIFTVTFNVLVNTVTNYTNITDTAYGSYNFQSGGVDFFSNTISNTVNTTVDPFNARIVKSVNKSFSYIGDTLTYTVTVANSGGLITSGTFYDTIPNGTSFVTDSFTNDGTPMIGANPQNGINVGTINASSIKTLTFRVNVSSISSPNPMPNNAFMVMSYSITPTIANTEQLITNTVFTQVNSPIINVNKSATQQFAKVGDNIDYTVTFTNTGNTTATNLVFIDTIPIGTHFVTDSLFLNGSQQLGKSPEPPGGFNVGTIPINSTSTVTFKIQVDTVPSPNPISNYATSTFGFIYNPVTGETASNGSNSGASKVFVLPQTKPVKSVNKVPVTIGDIITYTVSWRNEVNGQQENLVFFDTIPSGTHFVPNSAAINGTTIPGATVTLPNGLPLGNLNLGATVIVTFQVQVDTLPSPNTIPNQSMIKYSYQPDGFPLTTDTSVSNTVNSYVFLAQVNTSKGVNTSYATCGDIITYTITVPNFGNATATNVIVSDTVPSGTTFVPGSILVNGASTGGTPASISIGTINPGASATTSFQVKIQC